jgi:hypothetical protein
MYPGSSGSSHNVNKNSPGNGNGKWQGLPGLTNMRSSLVIPTRKRAYGNKRDYVFCVNQLAGGVGKRSGQFVPGAGGGVKDCTPTDDISYFINILNTYAASKGLLFGLKGITETIRQDIEGVTGTFVDFETFLGSEIDKKLQKEVREAIRIINALEINIGVLSSADRQLHVATMLNVLHKEELEIAGFGESVLGGKATAYGTNPSAKTPVVSIFAGGYTNSCSSSDPLMSLIRKSGVYNPISPSYVNGETVSLAITNSSITSINYEWLLYNFGDNFSDYPAEIVPGQVGDAFPWVNKNASLDAAVKAVMEPIKESTPGTSVTLTIAGTTIPVPSRFASVNGAREYDVPSLFDSVLASEYKRTTIGFYTDPEGFPMERFETFWGPSLSAYREMFDVNNELIPPYNNINKSSTTFTNSVLGSTDQKTNNPLDGVIVQRVFDFGEDNDDDPFAALSDLKDTNQAIIFTAFSGTKIARNDDELWAIDKAYTDVNNNSTPIGDCSGIY